MSSTRLVVGLGLLALRGAARFAERLTGAPSTGVDAAPDGEGRDTDALEGQPSEGSGEGVAPRTKERLSPMVPGALLAVTVDAERWLDRSTPKSKTASSRRSAGGRNRTSLKEATMKRTRELDRRGRREAELGADRVLDAWNSILSDVSMGIIRHVDMDEITRSIDVNAIADRIDIDRIVSRVDVNEIADAVDAARIVGRLDLAQLARQVMEDIGVSQIIRESSGSLAVETVDSLRLRGADADDRVSRFVDGVLRRQQPRDVEVDVEFVDVEPDRPDDEPGIQTEHE